MVSRPSEIDEVGVRRIFRTAVSPENASDAFRWGGTSERETQAAVASQGQPTASWRSPTPTSGGDASAT